jgi:hypothetical protein
MDVRVKTGITETIVKGKVFKFKGPKVTLSIAGFFG